MIYKGRIVDIKANYAIVMTDKVEFYKVKKKNGVLLGKQIIFLEEDLYKNNKNNRLISHAAVIIFLLISSVLLNQFSTFNDISSIPAAKISVDINPSVELEINKDFIVISIESINSEGESIAGKHMIGKKIDEVLYNMLYNAKSENYLTEEKNYVLIGICRLNDDIAELGDFEGDLNNRINSNAELEYVNIIILQGDNQKLELSRQHDLSIGKYLLYLNVNSEGTDLKMEDAKKMTTQELVKYSSQKRSGTDDLEENAADETSEPEDASINQNQHQNEKQDQNQVQNSEQSDENNTDAGNQNDNGTSEEKPYDNTKGGYENNQPAVNEQDNGNKPLEPEQVLPEDMDGSLNNDVTQNSDSNFENSGSIPAQEHNEQNRDITTGGTENQKGKLN